MNSAEQYLADLRQRATRLVVPAEPTETATVVHDRYDTATWDEVSQFPAIAGFTERMRIEHDYVDEFMADTFNLLVKGAPQVRAAEDIATTHRPHQPMIATLRDNTGTKQLRTMTPNSPYTAAMGLVSLTDELEQTFDHLKHAKDQAQEAQTKREQSAEAMQKAIEALAEAERAAPEDQGELAEQAEAALDAADQAADEAEQAQQDADDAAGNAAFAAQAALQKAAENATQERRAEEELMRGFGIEDGELQRMDFQERAALAQRLSRSRLAKFSDMIGQFRQLQSAESRRRVQHVPDEITNVILGNDLHRLMPQELLNLAAPETEDDFWLRYVNNELLQYELSGVERMGQGPIIVVCDESGSMEGAPEAWSKALSLALCQQARQLKRDFHYIGFSSASQQFHIAMPGGKAPLHDVLRMTEHFFNGGTVYEPPLRQAMELVAEYHVAGKEKPDIVFITDEEYGRLPERFVEEWNTLKRLTSMRCFGIAMCPTINGALSVLSDNTRTVAELTAHEVSDLFRLI